MCHFTVMMLDKVSVPHINSIQCNWIRRLEKCKKRMDQGTEKWIPCNTEDTVTCFEFSDLLPHLYLINILHKIQITALFATTFKARLSKPVFINWMILLITENDTENPTIYTVFYYQHTYCGWLSFHSSLYLAHGHDVWTEHCWEELFKCLNAMTIKASYRIYSVQWQCLDFHQVRPSPMCFTNTSLTSIGP